MIRYSAQKNRAWPAPLEISPARKRARRAWGGQSLTGFTLLEMVISIALFSAALLASVAVVLAAVTAQNKVAEFRRTQDDVRFGVEYLAKEIRTGTGFTTAGTCIGGWCPELRFTNDRNIPVRYCLNNDALSRKAGVGLACNSLSTFLTSSDIRVTLLQFRLVGGAVGPSDGQPMVTIVLRGESLASQKARVRTDINIQTTITQRLRDY